MIDSVVDVNARPPAKDFLCAWCFDEEGIDVPASTEIKGLALCRKHASEHAKAGTKVAIQVNNTPPAIVPDAVKPSKKIRRPGPKNLSPSSVISGKGHAEGFIIKDLGLRESYNQVLKTLQALLKELDAKIAVLEDERDKINDTIASFSEFMGPK